MIFRLLLGPHKLLRYGCLIVAAMFSLSGCASFRKPIEEPVIPAEEPEPEKPRVALVLGGGAARGFAHVGVLRILEQEKIPIDMIVGTSVGSLIGAIYASDLNTFELEWIAFQLEKDDIFDFSILKSATGPVKGDKLERFVENNIKAETVEQLLLPFYAVAADLNTGEPVVFSSGPVKTAIRASCSIPGVFTPLNHNDRQLIDGGVLGNIAPEIARQNGANFVIVVSIGKTIQNLETTNIVNITMQAISIMSSRIDHYKSRDADVLITPEIGDVGMMEFSRKKECMEAGIAAAREAMPELRRKLDNFGKPAPDSTVVEGVEG